MSLDIDIQSYAGETGQAAADQQVVNPEPVHQEAGDYQYPELSALPQAQQDAGINPQAENFRALREEVHRMKAEREEEKRDFELQLQMLRANKSQAVDQPQEKQFLDGMKDDDVPSVGELRREWAAKEAMYQQRLEELQVAQMHSDYAEVIEKHTIPLIKQKPYLAQAIQGSKNAAQVAYELGKMEQLAAQKAQAPQRSENAQRIVENSRKPGTLSQAGGQGALSKADYYATMSQEEFMKLAAQNMGEI